jgi:hypothetical protein
MNYLLVVQVFVRIPSTHQGRAATILEFPLENDRRSFINASTNIKFEGLAWSRQWKAPFLSIIASATSVLMTTTGGKVGQLLAKTVTKAMIGGPNSKFMPFAAALVTSLMYREE